MMRCDSGRSLHLLDIENLGRGPMCEGQWLSWAVKRFEAVVGLGPDDLEVGAASTYVFKRVAFSLPRSMRLVPAGGGPDAADLRLLDEAQPQWTACRFARVVIGSGDHIFAPLAHRFRSLGVVTWAASWADQMSPVLRDAVDEVRYLDDRRLTATDGVVTLDLRDDAMEAVA